MEPVLSVSPVGRGQIVTQVSLFTAYNLFQNLANTNCPANINMPYNTNYISCLQSASGVFTVRTVRNSVWDAV